MRFDDTGTQARMGEVRRAGVFAAFAHAKSPRLEAWAADFEQRTEGVGMAWHNDADTSPLGRMEAALRALLLPAASGRGGACALCLAPAVPWAAHVQVHEDPRGASVRILWCLGCAEADPWLQQLADNDNAPPGCRAAAIRFTDLHYELHDRVLAKAGVGGLQAVFHVQRDLPAPLTLRKPTDRWALPTDRNLR